MSVGLLEVRERVDVAPPDESRIGVHSLGRHHAGNKLASIVLDTPGPGDVEDFLEGVRDGCRTVPEQGLVIHVCAHPRCTAGPGVTARKRGPHGPPLRRIVRVPEIDRSHLVLAVTGRVEVALHDSQGALASLEESSSLAFIAHREIIQQLDRHAQRATSAHQRKSFCVKGLRVGASSVVCPCIAVMGLVPAACNRVVETTGGAAHDVRRDHRGVSMPRGARPDPA
jgi:hypothetical protein